MRLLERAATNMPDFTRFDFGVTADQEWQSPPIERQVGFNRPNARSCSLSGARFDHVALSGGAAKAAALGARVSPLALERQSMFAAVLPLELGAPLSRARFDSIGAPSAASRSDSHLYVIGCSWEERKRREFNRQWRAHVLNPDAELTADALTKTAKPVFEALLELGKGAVDLSGLHPSRVNGVHLAVVLRATLRHKGATKGWDEALEVAREALRIAKLDERKVLSGLIKK